MNFGATKGELRINSLLESAFESYTLRPLNVRPWPRSYPAFNLMLFTLSSFAPGRYRKRMDEHYTGTTIAVAWADQQHVHVMSCNSGLHN